MEEQEGEEEGVEEEEEENVVKLAREVGMNAKYYPFHIS